MDPAIQQGATMAALTLTGTIAGLFFGYLKDRDKLRFDTDLNNLKSQNTTQAGQIARLTVTQAECELKHKECEEKHNTTELRIVDSERDRESLWAEIESLKNQKKDRTDGHNPLRTDPD